jgi:rod shape-determining protein MreB and related proteins
MFTALKPVIYVQISPQRLTMKNLKSGLVISEVPEMAISARPKPTILTVGPEARVVAASTPGAQVVNPFAHPRSLVSDFTAAEQMLKHYMRRMLGNSLFQPAPVVVIHPLGSPAGGFTQIESRALREMAVGSGASEVIVWTGRALTDQEVLSRKFPAGEGEVD